MKACPLKASVEVYSARIITPLLVHGARRDRAEMRVPSLKGCMRFLARAVWGKAFSLPEVAKLDSFIFGSTERASSVKMRLRWSTRDVLPASGYILTCSSNRARTDGFPPGKTFEIEVAFRDPSVKDIFEDILWLFSALGGFGRRWRLGYGTVLISPKDGGNPVLSVPPEKIKSAIRKRIRMLEQNSRELLKTIVNKENQRSSGRSGQDYPIYGDLCVLRLTEKEWSKIWRNKLCQIMGRIRGEVGGNPRRYGRSPWHVVFRPHVESGILIVWWFRDIGRMSCEVLKRMGYGILEA